MRNLITVAFIAAVGLSGTARADTIEPTSYDMLNGQIVYFDLTYDGTGDNRTSLALLTDGLGDLTDDVIPTDNWNTNIPSSRWPYVGWRSGEPTITFSFAVPHEFDSVVINMDHSHEGAVDVPNTVEITVGANLPRLFNVADPAAGTPAPPVSQSFDVGGDVGDTIAVKFTRKTEWIMISEIDFDGTPQVSEIDNCDLQPAGNESADVIWVDVSSDGTTLSVLVKLCDDIDPKVHYRVHFDYDDGAGYNVPDTPTNGDCRTTSDDTMMLRGTKATGPGEIYDDTDMLWYDVNYDELSANGASLGGGDTVLIWVDTRHKNVGDRVPNTEGGDGCSKPQIIGEVIEHTLVGN